MDLVAVGVEVVVAFLEAAGEAAGVALGAVVALMSSAKAGNGSKVARIRSARGMRFIEREYGKSATPVDDNCCLQFAVNAGRAGKNVRIVGLSLFVG